MITEITQIFNRDLERLHTEIEAFENEEDLWKITGTITNPAGNLCLHLIGNLNTYIGKQLGNTGYIRNRELEFSQKGIAKAVLLTQIMQTKTVVVNTLTTLTDKNLSETYPENTLGYPMTTGFFLVHLTAHLSYHLGQINYLRRILG